MAILHHTSHDGVTKERLQTHDGSLQYFDAWDNTKYSPEWGFLGNPQNLRVFWGKIPKTPQTLYYLCPQNFPNSFLGIFRDKTPINPKIEVIPVPKISLKVSNGLSPSPPCPQKSGRGQGNSGIGAPFYHTTPNIGWARARVLPLSLRAWSLCIVRIGKL